MQKGWLVGAATWVTWVVVVVVRMVVDSQTIGRLIYGQVNN